MAPGQNIERFIHKEKIMVAVNSTPQVLNAVNIPYVTLDEAFALLSTEFGRFVALAKTLKGDDWRKPTACTAWNVRDMLAHQAGSYASGTGYKEMIHQYMSRPKAGQLPEDATNETQLFDRKGKSPAELIAELESTGPVAVQKWAYQFRLVKFVTIPHRTAGTLNVGHLMKVIHSRDTWMHRLDICRAVGCNFEQTVEHDGRIAALVMLDVARCLHKQMDNRSLVFDLAGTAGGRWKIGNADPSATINMDVLEFNIFASGRSTYEQPRAQTAIVGDVAWAEAMLKNLLVLY
jgi:uncharacterized protein (TIGR03083 family)